MNEFKERYINPFTDYGFKRLFGEEPNTHIFNYLNCLVWAIFICLNSYKHGAKIILLFELPNMLFLRHYKRVFENKIHYIAYLL